MHLQSTDTMQCGVSPHSACLESRCKWMPRTGNCRNAQNMFWSMARKNKDALVLGRDESPNQIRTQTWVENGQLTPDVLNFPESHHYVQASLHHLVQLSVHGHSGFAAGKSKRELRFKWDIPVMCNCGFGSSVYTAFWPLTTHSGQKDSKKGSTKQKKSNKNNKQFLSSLPQNNRKSCNITTLLTAEINNSSATHRRNNPDS